MQPLWLCRSQGGQISTTLNSRVDEKGSEKWEQDAEWTVRRKRSDQSTVRIRRWWWRELGIPTTDVTNCHGAYPQEHRAA